jgi:hypothetical protein
MLVRPTTILLFLPLAFALPTKPKVYLRFVLGGLLFGIFQATLNQVLYGNPLMTGYRGELMSSVVVPELAKRIVQFGKWLFDMMTPVFLPAWLVRLPLVAAGLLCFLILRAEIHEIRRLRVLDVKAYEAVYKTSCLAVTGAVPERSVVLAMQLSGALTCYTKVLPVRWDIMAPKQFDLLRQKAALNGYGIYALLFPFEEREFRKSAPGACEKIASYQFVTPWKYQGP